MHPELIYALVVYSQNMSFGFPHQSSLDVLIEGYPDCKQLRGEYVESSVQNRLIAVIAQ